MSTSPGSIVFAGTPQLAVPSLQTLARSENIVAVVTQPDRRSGRGQKLTPPAVKTSATSMKLPVYQPDSPSLDDLRELLVQLQPDLLVVVAFGRILPGDLLTLPGLFCINLHPSLLPRYRGPAPIPRALINGDTETGITIQKIAPEVDSGQVILQQSLPIYPDDTCGTLSERLAREGAAILHRAIQLIKANAFSLVPQQGDVSFAPKITKSTAKIDWSLSGTRLHHLIRAMNPWPGAYTGFHRGPLKLWKSMPLPDYNTSSPPGTVVETQGEKGFIVQTGEGSLCVLETQVSGKRRTSAADFLRGYHIKRGHILGD